MKKTFLALALAAAAVPMTFAAQAPTANPPADKTPAASTKKPAKKHKKAVKKATPAAKASAVKPLAMVPVKK